MIPAGIERDREIAVIKDEAGCLQWTPTTADNALIPICKFVNNSNHPCHSCDGNKHKSRSTNIACAMVLLDEMIARWDFVQITSCQRGFVIELIRDKRPIYNVFGVDLADAISGVWQAQA